jgi:hypothetical protein
MKCSVCKGSKKFGGRPCGNCGGTGVENSNILPRGVQAAQGAMLLSPDEKIFRCKITCKCKAALLLELPVSVKHVTHAITCQVCQTTYIWRDGVLGRRSSDGSTKILTKKTVDEVRPSDKSFAVEPDPKNGWVN